MPISLDEVNRAMMAKSRAEGFCWCVVPLRQMVDVRGLVHSPCQQPITDASYNLTAQQRGQAVNAFYPDHTFGKGKTPADSDDNAGTPPAI